jgi:hypothetical protein
LARRTSQELDTSHLRAWYRFNRYEVCDGHIRPAKSAKLERYDPWERHEVSREHSGAEPPPYAELIQLAKDCRLRPVTSGGIIGPRQPSEARYSLDSESEERLCNWCSQNGLLGLLLEQTLTVTLPYRWLAQKVDLEALAEVQSRGKKTPVKPNLKPDRYVASSSVYYRAGAAWLEASHHAEIAASRERFKQGEVVLEEDLPAESHPPGAIVRVIRGRAGIRHYGWEWQPLAESWGPYFPGVPEEERDTYEYPHPDEEKFWNQYAEPLDSFLDGASSLAGTVDCLHGLDPKERLDEGDLARVQAACRELEQLAGTPCLNVDPEGRLRQGWLNRSLLGTFATMAILDLSRVGQKEAKKKAATKKARSRRKRTSK